ncbi:hypothetical protein EN844_24585 [Mesorhizobium sp. M3A.F.Ca.ET.201.01.1.1]|uniref:hypothetical protein n=1 Tax=Mesorhizobium sp. M3A.F.Ca.ET.201.01.1.1 TaxID=2563946 RepID=UPI0010936FC4|nr:hypothetical protein [Mesorhizobium sp. M3A.F.Ca.ET.201.01.1.1]TGS63012.1 hypothetical protein EN844_24585 [Mesorhizobium sp. M3A.F.Ca.ET.201.01.1.1]
MSRNTLLQLIAAVITIAVLAGIHQGAGWFLNRMSLDFTLGMLFGMFLVLAVWIYEDRKARRSRAIGDISPAEQKSARHSIDL